MHDLRHWMTLAAPLTEAKSARWLYHVTDRSLVASILQDGFDPDSYWGTLPIIEYYIRMKLVHDPVVFRVAMTRFHTSFLEPDYRGLQDPPTSEVLDMSETDVEDAWEASDQSWQACLAIIGSVQYRGPLYVTEADIA